MAGKLLVNSSLRTEIAKLSKHWKVLNVAYEDFTKKKIEFAGEIARVWKQALELDAENRTNANQNHFREQLKEFIQSDDKSILSKWVGIGARAKDLLPYANSLPPQRDSLYALALAVQKKQPIKRWISKGELTSESTVRQVFALTQNKPRAASQEYEGVDILKISYPSRESYSAFLEIQEELEAFLNERSIHFSYCGDFARYEKDSAKHYERSGELFFKLAKTHVREAIMKKVDQSYRNHISTKKASFNKQLLALGYAKEDVNVAQCMTIEELDQLCERMELNEGGQWDTLRNDLYVQAMSETSLPLSVQRIESAAENVKSRFQKIEKPIPRKKANYSGFKV